MPIPNCNNQYQPLTPWLKRGACAAHLVKFLAEPINLEQYLAALALVPKLPNRLWTDAYLAAFALAVNARLVSFDNDYQRFAGLDFLHLKWQLP